MKRLLQWLKSYPIILLLIALVDIVGGVLILANNIGEFSRLASWSEEQYADMRATFEYVSFPMSAYFFGGTVMNVCAVIAGIGLLLERRWGWWLECGVVHHSPHSQRALRAFTNPRPAGSRTPIAFTNSASRAPHQRVRERFRTEWPHLTKEKVSRASTQDANRERGLITHDALSLHVIAAYVAAPHGPSRHPVHSDAPLSSHPGEGLVHQTTVSANSLYGSRKVAFGTHRTTCELCAGRGIITIDGRTGLSGGTVALLLISLDSSSLNVLAKASKLATQMMITRHPFFGAFAFLG